jgi:hypothetical protein
MIETFVSTFQEWHYFAGGGCLGFVGGWIAHAWFHRRYYRDG